MQKPKDRLEITKQKLIKATSELLYERGQQYKGLTSREIAKTAGVPLGMINYCFGSKDNLVLQVFLDTYEKKMEEEQHEEILKIYKDVNDPLEFFRISAFKIMKAFLDHYECTESILKYIITEYSVEKTLKGHVIIKEYYGDSKSEEECKRIAFMMSNVFQLAILRHKEYKENFGIDLLDDKQLMIFINEQIERFVC